MPTEQALTRAAMAYELWYATQPQYLMEHDPIAYDALRKGFIAGYLEGYEGALHMVAHYIEKRLDTEQGG